MPEKFPTITSEEELKEERKKELEIPFKVPREKYRYLLLLWQDKDRIPENMVLLLLKQLQGQKLNQYEDVAFHVFKNQWWKEKYGANLYDMEATAINEIVDRELQKVTIKIVSPTTIEKLEPEKVEREKAAKEKEGPEQEPIIVLNENNRHLLLLWQNRDDLPEEIVQILRKKFSGQKITSEEQGKLDVFRNKWWKEKYGFGFSDIKKRKAVLEGKIIKPKKHQSIYRILSPEELEKKIKTKTVNIDIQLANLKKEHEEFKKRAEESRQADGEYDPETYRQDEEFVKEILKLEKERIEKNEKLEKEKLKKQQELGLPDNFFEILKTRNHEKIQLLKKKMIENDPENIERTEAIFWLFALVVGGIKHRRYKSEQELERMKEDIFYTTEQEFLLTQFIYANKDNRDTLRNFWDIGKYMAQIFDQEASLRTYKSGLLGQVAAWHLLKRIGKKPQLSTPDEDAWYSIDLWGGKEMAIQVKSSKKVKKTHIKRVDRIAFPALSYQDGKTEKLVSAKRGTEEAFMINIEKYSQLKGRDIKGYWLDIKNNQKEIDLITGMPTDEVVEKIKKELEETERK